MALEPRLTTNCPPEISSVQRKIQSACKGVRLDYCASALLAEYSACLNQGCGDYEQFRRNMDGAVAALDANARMHFKVNN